MPQIRKVQAIPAMPAAGLYAAGDAVGGILQFVGVVDYPGKGGKIVGVTLIDKAAQSIGITLQLFNALFTATADNAPYAPSDADIVNAFGNVVFIAGDYAGGTLNKTAYKDVDIDFQTGAASMDLFGQLFTQGAPNYAAGDIVVMLHVIQEEVAAGSR